MIVDNLWNYCSIPEETLQSTAKENLIRIVRFINEDKDKTQISRKNNKSEIISTSSSNSNTNSNQFFSRIKNPFRGNQISSNTNSNENEKINNNSFDKRNSDNKIDDSSNNKNYHPQRMWLNEMDIKTKNIDSSRFNYFQSFLSSSSSCCPSLLIQEAMEQKFPLLYTIERMRQRSFDLHNSSSFNLKSDLATYVPLNCSSGPRDTSEFPLKNTIVNFLEENCSQKVLLLHGNAGSGKSLFGRWLESYLWKLFIQGNNEV